MPQERRNLYRLLFVQPEAPPEVIKAAYRALMTTLRGHPDLGGNAEALAVSLRNYPLMVVARVLYGLGGFLLQESHQLALCLCGFLCLARAGAAQADLVPVSVPAR